LGRRTSIMAEQLSKNRFYYSLAQDSLIEDIRIFDEDNDGKSTYITLDNGELVKYSEWCSRPDSKSNWDDAILVYETNEPDSEIYKRIIRK
jgi:hypothetical protein